MPNHAIGRQRREYAVLVAAWPDKEPRYLQSLKHAQVRAGHGAITDNRFSLPTEPRHNARPCEERQQGMQSAQGGEDTMFSHIMIGSNDMARSKKFYDALFAAMGAGPGAEDARGRLA